VLELSKTCKTHSSKAQFYPLNTPSRAGITEDDPKWWAKIGKNLYDRRRVVWIELQSKISHTKEGNLLRSCCEVSWRMGSCNQRHLKMIKGINKWSTQSLQRIPRPIPTSYPPVPTGVTIFGPQRMREVGFLIRCSADYGWIQLGSIEND